MRAHACCTDDLVQIAGAKVQGHGEHTPDLQAQRLERFITCSTSLDGMSNCAQLSLLPNTHGPNSHPCPHAQSSPARPWFALGWRLAPALVPPGRALQPPLSRRWPQPLSAAQWHCAAPHPCRDTACVWGKEALGALTSMRAHHNAGWERRAGLWPRRKLSKTILLLEHCLCYAAREEIELHGEHVRRTSVLQVQWMHRPW